MRAGPVRARVRNACDRAAGSEKGAKPGRAGDRAGSGVPGPGLAGMGTRIGPVGPGSNLGLKREGAGVEYCGGCQCGRAPTVG